MRLGEGLKAKAINFLESDSGSAKAAKVVLAVVAVGGIVIAGAVAPNLFLLFKNYPRSRQYSPKQLRDVYYNLKFRGLIVAETCEDGYTRIRLTRKGERRLADLDLDNILIARPKKWDQKWRVLIFDLPVRYQRVREAFRWKIRDLGFEQLQKSAWIYPYPCEEEIVFLAEFYGVMRFVEVLTVERIMREEELRNKFDL
jgi:DNA-binding transcriptional regulator PaaX